MGRHGGFLANNDEAWNGMMVLYEHSGKIEIGTLAATFDNPQNPEETLAVVKGSHGKRMRPVPLMPMWKKQKALLERYRGESNAGK